MFHSRFFSSGCLFLRTVVFAAALFCPACGGGGSGGGGEGEGGEGTLLPSDGTPVVLTIEGEGFQLSVTCTPYRPGDYSGTVSDGELSINALPDGTAFQAEALTGSWEHGLSDISGRVEPLLMELEGQDSDGSLVSLRLDDLSLQISVREEGGRASGRVLKGQLVVNRQTSLLLNESYSFTVTPQS